MTILETAAETLPKPNVLATQASCYDVIIVGSGLSGLVTALNLSRHLRVLLITKKRLMDSNSSLAQGGICICLGKEDRKDFIHDTLAAGHYKNTLEAVEILVDESASAIDTLSSYGVEFSEDAAGDRDYTREGGHGKNRILHCADETGRYIMQALTQELLRRGNITVKEYTTCEDVLLFEGRVYGVAVHATGTDDLNGAAFASEYTEEPVTKNTSEPWKGGAEFSCGKQQGHGDTDDGCIQQTGKTTSELGCDKQQGQGAIDSGCAQKRGQSTADDGCYYAPFVVLATGGIGGVYENSTNYRHICGDAVAMAILHDIDLKDISYVQIHPTSFYDGQKDQRRFLISESARGEGAVLRNAKKERFTDELKPRDVVSAAIMAEMKKDKLPHEWLDFTTIPLDIASRFPNIYHYLKKAGYDATRDLIPIVPSQHYTMGGIHVSTYCHTNKKGLYAVGEAACTGVHGQNRLASNSLLESVVYGKRCAADINGKIKAAATDFVPEFFKRATELAKVANFEKSKFYSRAKRTELIRERVKKDAEIKAAK